MILLGTSGFSYPDWYGVFYPPGLDRSKQLDYYARQFHTVEINATYYRIPPPRTMASMERKTPADFVFVVKSHQDMTHRLSLDPEAYRAFHAAVRPLADARKLGGVLAQFPQGFHRSDEHERFLLEMQERMEGIPLFVEFRHNSWSGEEVFEFLEKEGLGYVSVDEPDLPGLLPRVARATGPLAYVRFHGRNKRNWYRRDTGDGPAALRGEGNPETSMAAAKRAALKGSPAAPKPVRDERRLLRYDYLYSEAELKEWADKIRELNQKTQKTFVFFNNCHAGHAATGAKLMRRLLDMPEPAVAEQRELL